MSGKKREFDFDLFEAMNIQISESEKRLLRNVSVMCVFFYVIAVFIMLHFLQLANTNEAGVLEATLFMNSFQHAVYHPLQMAHAFDDMGRCSRYFWLITLVGLLIYLYVVSQIIMKRHEDENTAKGSARLLTTTKDFKMLAEEYALEPTSKGKNAPDPNIILSQHVKYGLKPSKNTNVLIIGSAGSGKSFGIIKPNLMQMSSSYIVTDPSGEIFRAVGHMLLENGYSVKIFATTNATMPYSHCYNPFDYCYDERGDIDETRVSTMITLFLQNASGMAEAKAKSGDDFWDKAARALLTACAMYLLEFRPEEEHNMYQILRLVQMGKVDESRSSAETKLDKRFNDARKNNPEAHCLSSYDTFKLAPAKTANSILISAGVDLNMFNQDKVRNLTTSDYYVTSRSAANGQIRRYKRDDAGNLIRTDRNLNLRTIGDEKTAVFVMTSQADPTYNFLVTMFYSQLFDVLYGRGEALAPSTWLVRGDDGYPLLSMLESEEEATKMAEAYRSAKIVKIKDEDKDAWYVCNRNAPKKYWINGLGSRGLLKKVYSKEVGEAFIKGFEKCKVEANRGNALPWHIQCLLDEFANIGEIPMFPQKLATSRKYEISAMVVLQSLSQLKSKYKDNWGDVISNCNCKVFLGTQDPETCKWLSEIMGEKTIRVMGRGLSKTGGSENISLDSRPLAKPDEVARLDSKKCYLMIGSEQAVLDYKFMANKHERWDELGDMDPKYNMSPEMLVVTTEKKLSRNGDAFAAIESMRDAAAAKNPDGKPVYKKSTVETRAQAVYEAGGTNKTKMAPTGAKAKAKADTLTDWENAEDDVNNTFGSGYKAYLPKT